MRPIQVQAQQVDLHPPVWLSFWTPRRRTRSASPCPSPSPTWTSPYSVRDRPADVPLASSRRRLSSSMTSMLSWADNTKYFDPAVMRHQITTALTLHQAIDATDTARLFATGGPYALDLRGSRARDDTPSGDPPDGAGTPEVLDGRVSVDGHEQVGLGEDGSEVVHQSVLAAEGEGVGVGPSEADRTRAEGQRLDYVGPAAYAGVEQHGGLAGGLDDVGQRV